MPATGNIHPPLDSGPPIKPWRSLAGVVPKILLMSEICLRYFSIPNYLLNNFVANMPQAYSNLTWKNKNMQLDLDSYCIDN